MCEVWLQIIQYGKFATKGIALWLTYVTSVVWWPDKSNVMNLYHLHDLRPSRYHFFASDVDFIEA